ncbi:hypothetical protein FRC04_009255 [Tulasnella sp. 424]|nr:hypothetical protein FRC04_009255 [Tulasnella sp. 424]KAG8973078.1 hypothetical protein FRC05_009086 [Tulasnella sp. 425]
MARLARSSSIISRSPFSTEERAIQWLLKVLAYPDMIENCYTRTLLKKWNAFCQLVNEGQGVPINDSPGSKKRILVISVSAYTQPWKAMQGSQTDWKFWTMLGMMAGWNVEVIADSLPIWDPTRQPTRENILSFAREHLKENKEGDQFVVVFSGHGDNEGLVLADGSHISPQELRAWFVKPLVSGTRLWTFFDCCESSNMLGLRHKVVYDKNQATGYQAAQGYTGGKDGDIRGAVISIGSAAGSSGEMDLEDPDMPTQPLHCGPLAWGAYYFYSFSCKEGEPLLAGFSPLMETILEPRPGQEVQITTSSNLREPALPMLRALS